MISGPTREFLDAYKTENDDRNALRYPIDLLNSLEGRGPVLDHRLQLEQGYILILFCNLGPSQGHYNGTRYTEDGMSQTKLFFRVACDSHKCDKLALP